MFKNLKGFNQFFLTHYTCETLLNPRVLLIIITFYSILYSLNAQYLCVFRNHRDNLQVHRLAAQIYPYKTGILLDSYWDATSRRYGYLLIDLSPHTPEDTRLRTYIWPGEPLTIYKPIDNREQKESVIKSL